MGFKGATAFVQTLASVSFSSQIWDLKNWNTSTISNNPAGFSSQIWDLKGEISLMERGLRMVLAAKYGI